jgi:thiamine-phosphate pyrophosphorylase
MDQRKKGSESYRSRLVLVTPPIEEAAHFAPILAEACAAGDVAAVILRLKPASDGELVEHIRLLAPPVHKVAASLILDGPPQQVEAANADGAHVRGSDAVAMARNTIKSDRIVGAANLPSRHDAMTAGENGADYVMFGEPDDAGKRLTVDSLVERVAWWSELFVIPCVAYAGGIGEIAPLVRAGADFVALGDEFTWNSPERAVAVIKEAESRLEMAEATV